MDLIGRQRVVVAVTSPLGQMLPVVPTDVSEFVYLKVEYKGGGQKKITEVRHPSVLQSAWSLTDGRVAFFLVNVATAAVSVPVSFHAEGWASSAGNQPNVHLNGRAVEARSWLGSERIELPGLSALMVAFAAAASS